MISDGLFLEQTVIGFALNDDACFSEFVEKLDVDDFTNKEHKVLCYCLKYIHNLGAKIPDENSIEIASKTYTADKQDYGGIDYVRKLKKSYIDDKLNPNFSILIKQLKLVSAKRFIGDKYLEPIIKVLNNPKSSPDDIKKWFNAAIDKIDKCTDDVAPFIYGDELINKYLKEINDRAVSKFYTTGLPTLDDKLTDGFKPQKLTVMAGFTGMAKSTMVSCMAHRMAVAGLGVGIFSMESPDVDIYDKFVSTITQIPLVRLSKDAASLTAEEHERIDKALSSLKSLPIFINDKVSLSMGDMKNSILSAKKKGKKIDVVFIDLFGKIEDVDTGENLAQKIQKECKNMRALAQELNVHFVMVVQIGRQGFGTVKKGKVKRPTLIDIKNANAYGEEVDIALLLHRNKYYIPTIQDDILEIHIAKQRRGSTSVVFFDLDPETATVTPTGRVPHDWGNNG